MDLPPKPDDTGRGKNAGIFDLFAGHHMCADIPAVYVVPPPQRMLAAPPSHFDGGALVSYLSSNCRVGRDEWVKELMEFVSVASYGNCLHNAEGAGGRSQGFEGSRADAKMARIRSHKFNIAHEGYVESYYVSEKLWEPYLAGSVPIYYGAGKELELERILPEHSWINALNYPSTKELAEYLHELDKDPIKYATYFDWKTKPLPPNFLSIRNFDWTNFACNVCNSPDI